MCLVASWLRRGSPNDPTKVRSTCQDGQVDGETEAPGPPVRDMPSDGSPRALIGPRPACLAQYIRFRAEVESTSAHTLQRLAAADQVALGDCSPRAPTDPYVRTLPHTVPQIMGSLHDEAGSALRGQEPKGDGEARRRISPSASSGCCCGDSATYAIDSRLPGGTCSSLLSSQ